MSSSFKVILTENGNASTYSNDNFNMRSVPFAVSDVHLVSIKSYKLLTKGKDVKRTYDLKLSLEGITHEFLPGDTIGVLPSNDFEEVTALLDRLNIKSFYRIDISADTALKKSPLKYLPIEGSVINLFTYYIDIRTPPKKLFLKALIKFTRDKDEIRQLEELSAARSAQKYLELINERRTLLSILKLFPSCFPSLEVILQYSQPLQPRVFSISSSPLSKYLSITFFIVDNPDGTKGVCTGYLEKCMEQSCNEDVRIPIYFRKPTSFRIPNSNKDSILIATGTGIAPFMGLFQYHSLLKMSHKRDIICYYGCRYSDRDYLYKDDMEHFLRLGIIKKLYLAFSREDKCYVQDKINENSREFVEHVRDKDVVIYICGQAKTMVRDVKIAIAENLKRYSDCKEDLLENLINNGKIIVDVWNT